MKRIPAVLFLCCCLFIQQFSFAQEPVFTWAKNLGSSGFNTGYHVATDPAGNVYTAGQFENTGDFDPGPGTFNLTSTATVVNGRNCYISKLDSAGNFLWAKSIPNTNYEVITSIVLDSAGNLYASGTFQGTAVFDPAGGVPNLVSAGSIELFIFKIDAAGNFIWARQLDTNSGLAALIALRGSSLYLSVGFTGTVDFDPGPGVISQSAPVNDADFVIAKFDTSFTVISVRPLGDSVLAMPYLMAVDSVENIFLYGSFGGTRDFDPGPGTYNLTANGADLFILKLDSALNFIWAGSFGGPGGAFIGSMAVDLSGNVYVSGVNTDTFDLDTGPGIYNVTTAGIYLIKVNASGSFEWGNHIGGTQILSNYKVTVDVLGNIYSIGVFGETLDFDPGPGVFNLSAVGFEDIFIYKLDPSGSLVWAKRLGSGGSDQGFGIFVDAALNIHATGSYEGAVDFDPGPGIYNLVAPIRNIFVLKWAQPSIIPLTLLDFSAQALTSSKVRLKWETGQEQNTDNFIIERGKGQAKFEPVGTVKAVGNSTFNEKYTFYDNDPLDGTNFYRLKMMDYDGVFTYSEVEAVNITKTQLQLFPNPAKSVVFLQLYNKNETAVLQIKDATGKLVKEETLKLNGTQLHPLNIEFLPPGKFHLSLQTKTVRETAEFIKL